MSRIPYFCRYEQNRIKHGRCKTRVKTEGEKEGEKVDPDQGGRNETKGKKHAS